MGIPAIMDGAPRGASRRADARAACIDTSGPSFTGTEIGRAGGDVIIAGAAAIVCPGVAARAFSAVGEGCGSGFEVTN